MAGQNDPWAAFADAQPTQSNDPWAAFEDDAAPVQSPVQARPRPEDAPGYVSNSARGVSDRLSDLVGGVYRGVGSVMQYGGQAVEAGFDAVGLPLPTNEELPFSVMAPSEALRQIGGGVADADFGFKPNFTVDRALENPTLGNILGAIGENAPAALADMAGMATSMPLYALSRQDALAQTRYDNNGGNGGATPFKEYAEAAPATALSLALDRASLSKLTGKGGDEVIEGAADVAGATLKGGAREGVTEGIQEGGIEYAGETVGTEKGWDAETALKRGAGGVLIGAPTGGLVGGVSAGLRMTPQEIEQEAERLGVSPEEVVRLYEKGIGAQDVGDVIANNTGTDIPAPPTNPRERNVQRAKTERQMAADLSGQTDVIRREDIEGFDDDGNPLYREGAQPTQDPRGRQANPDTLGAIREVQRAAENRGFTLSDERADLAARDVQNGMSPDEAVLSYAPEQNRRDFGVADARRDRREGALAGGERADGTESGGFTQGRDYQAAGSERPQGRGESVLLLDAQYGKDGKLSAGEQVFSDGDAVMNEDGSVSVRVTTGDGRTMLIPMSRITVESTPENPRMEQDFEGRSTRQAPGVGTQTPGPRSRTDGISSKSVQNPVRDVEPGPEDVIPAPEPGPQPEPTPREGETFRQDREPESRGFDEVNRAPNPEGLGRELANPNPREPEAPQTEQTAPESTGEVTGEVEQTAPEPTETEQTNRRQVEGIAAQWEGEMGDAGMASAVRAGLKSRPYPDADTVAFQQKKLDEARAKKDGTAAPEQDSWTIESVVAVSDREKKDFQEAKAVPEIADVFSEAEAAAAQTVKSLNDQGYSMQRKEDMPPEVRKRADTVTGLAGTMARLSKQGVAVARGYKRANLEQRDKTAAAARKAIRELQGQPQTAPEQTGQTEPKPKTGFQKAEEKRQAQGGKFREPSQDKKRQEATRKKMEDAEQSSALLDEVDTAIAAAEAKAKDPAEAKIQNIADAKENQKLKGTDARMDAASIKSAQDRVGFVEFKTKRGTFKVRNTPARLKEFRRRFATAGTNRNPTKDYKRPEPIRSTATAIKDAIMDGDLPYAYELAKASAADLVFGEGPRGVNLYPPGQSQKIGGADTVVVQGKDGWAVIVPSTGRSLSQGARSRADAVKSAREAVARVGEVKFREAMDRNSTDSKQADLEAEFVSQNKLDAEADVAPKAETKPEAKKEPEGEPGSVEKLMSMLRKLSKDPNVLPQELLAVAREAGVKEHLPIIEALSNNSRMEDLEIDVSTKKDAARGSYSRRTDDSQRKITVSLKFLESLLKGDANQVYKDMRPQLLVSEVIVHEMIHATTARAINFKLNKALTSQADAIQAKLKKWKKDNPAEYSRLSPSARLGVDEVIKKTTELPTYGLTNPEFQAFLKTVPGIQKGRTLFDDFVNMVRTALGMKSSNESLLSDVIEVSKKLMDLDQSFKNGDVRGLEDKLPSDFGKDGATYTDALPKLSPGQYAKRIAETAGGKASDWKDVPRDISSLAQSIRDAAGGLTSSGRATKSSVMRDMFRSVLASTDGNMRMLAAKFDSPTMKSLADMFHATAGKGSGAEMTLDEAISSRMNTRLSEVDTLSAFIRDNKLDSKAVIAAVENPRKPRTGRIGEAAKMLDAFVKEELRYLRESGVELGEVKDGYFPRELERALVSRKRGEFVAAAMRAYKKTAQENGETMSDVEARSRAESYWENTVFGDSGTPGYSAPSGNGNDFTNSRVFSKAAAKELEQFYVRDIDAILGGYTQRAVRRAEIAKRFGDRWSKWAELEEKMKKEDPDTQNVFGDLRDLVAVSAGVQRTSAGSAAQHGLSMLRTWTTLATLEKAALASLGELVLAPMRGATGNVAGDLAQNMNNLGGHIWNTVRGMTGSGKSFSLDKAYEFAQDLGAIAGHGSNHLMAARFAGGDPVGKIQSKAMASFFRRNMLEQLTNYTRVTTLQNAQVFLRRLSADMAKSDGKKNATFLRELGVPAGKEAEFATFVRKFGDKYPTFEQMTRAGDMGKAYKTALLRFTDQTVMRPSNSTRPKWAAHPLGAVVFQLQSFGYAFQKNVLNRYARIGSNVLTGKDMSRLEAAGTVLSMSATLGVLVAFQAMLSELRREIYSPDGRELTDQAKLEEALSRAGLLGIADPYIQTISGVRYNRPIISSVLGPAIGGVGGALNTFANAAMRNSENTNTAERNMAKATYNWFIEPALQVGMTWVPFSAGSAFASAYAIPRMEPAFTDAVAGERQTRRGQDAITGLFESSKSGGSRNKYGGSRNNYGGSGNNYGGKYD